MSLESLQFSILVRCPSCGSGTPINGITTSVLCGHCSNVFPLSEEHWLRLIGDFMRDDLRVERGESDDTEVIAPWGKFNVEHGHCDPVCPHCSRELDEATLKQLAAPVDCPACKKQVGVRPPPDWFVKVNPGVRWLVGETFEVEARSVKEEAPISVHCMNCAAVLDIDGASRKVSCEHCDSENFLPDQIWLRLHPASVKKPWSILIETGAADYSLPDGIEDFCDVAHAPDGCLVAAFIEETEYDEDDDDEDNGPIAARVIKFDQQGLIAWVRDDIDFDDDARLLCSPDGSKLILLFSGGEGFLVLDPASGGTIDRIECSDTTGEQEDQPPELMRTLQLHNAEGVELAPDGTLVVLRNGPADSLPVFTRYALDGTPMPMWPPAAEPPPDPPPAEEPVKRKGGFFSRLFARPRVEEPEPEPETTFPEWDALPDRLLVPPRDVVFTFSPGGDLILMAKDRKRLAHFGRDGKLVESHPITGFSKVLNWCSIGVDEFESVYLAYMPEDYWQSGGGMHLYRLPLGGEPELFRGWHVDPACQLGDSEAQMKVRADGTLFIGSALSNLRVVSPEGKLVFRTPATVEFDDIQHKRYQEHN